MQRGGVGEGSLSIYAQLKAKRVMKHVAFIIKQPLFSGMKPFFDFVFGGDLGDKLIFFLSHQVLQGGNALLCKEKEHFFNTKSTSLEIFQKRCVCRWSGGPALHRSVLSPPSARGHKGSEFRALATHDAKGTSGTAALARGSSVLFQSYIPRE